MFNLPFNTQPIWDARLGIGTDKFVLNAQPDGLSTQREFVFQYQIIATNGMPQELVPLVTRGMIWSKDNVFNQLFNNQLIWDARLGIGTDKFVLNAQPDGLSTQREFVFQYQIIATNGMPQELVPLVTRGMIW